MVRFAVLLLTAARALQVPTAPPRRGVVVAAAPGEPLYLCEAHVALAWLLEKETKGGTDHLRQAPLPARGQRRGNVDDAAVGAAPR